jgi:hypothetical protein
MTRFFARFMCAVAVSLALGAAQPAFSVPVMFQFNLPAWTFVVGNAAEYGTSGVLTVTLDNGAATFLNHTYLNSSIISARVAAIDGAFDHVFSGNLGFGAPDRSYIRTDASGTPTLDLARSADPSAHQFLDGTFFLQLAATSLDSTHGVFNSVSISSQIDAISNAAVMPYDPIENVYPGLVVRGQVVGLVPEPSALGLMAAGLGVLAIRRRRRCLGH